MNDLKYYFLFILVSIFGLLGIILITNQILRTAIGAGGTFISAYIFLNIITNLPSYQKFIAPILSVLGKISRDAELDSIAYNIQGNLNQYRQVVNQEYSDLVPETVLEWVNHENEEEFHEIYNGKLILKLHPSSENRINLVKATMAQVSKGVIPESRIYVASQINDSIDLSLTNKILSEQDRTSLLYFRNEVLVPKLRDSMILNYFRCMEILDDEGLFTRLYLRELKQLAFRHGLKTANLPEIRQDTTDFLEFADQIAKKERGVDVILDYYGSHIRTGIVMVANPIWFQKVGVHPYVKRAIDKFQAGCEIVYIIGWEPTIRYTESVITYLIMNHDIEPIRDSIKWYTVGNLRRLCVAMRKKDT